ncbi:MAG: glycosyltransferase, partial [Candidatus Binatia bacterium]
MAKGVDISVILPVFNEAQNLGPLLDRLDSLKLADVEVIVVDDGSTDGTSE